MNRLLDKIILYFLGALTLLLLLAVSVAPQHLKESVLEETGEVITECTSEEKRYQEYCHAEGGLEVGAQVFMASNWDS